MKYQKIRTLGHRSLKNLWDGDIEITEKVDGSQYKFWTGEDGGIRHGTKRTELKLKDGGVSDKLFNPVVRHMEEHGDKVPAYLSLFGETLSKPKHNTLKYNVVPKGHLALWGAYDESNDRWLTHAQLRGLAHDLLCDVVPLICTLTENTQPLTLDILDKLLDKESFLGGAKIEGLVFKNYGHDLMIDDQYIPFLAGKFVSDKFKEQQVKNWKPGGNALQEYMDSFATEARWLKTIQCLRDSGELDRTPRDIGKLIGWMRLDMEAEHSDDVKDWLYKYFLPKIHKSMNHGFPEFYKRWLVEHSEPRKLPYNPITTNTVPNMENAVEEEPITGSLSRDDALEPGDKGYIES